MGDHKIITANFGDIITPAKISYRRSWKNYTKESLINQLMEVQYDLEITTVQDLYNEIENKIINIVDKVAPIRKFTNNQQEESSNHPIWLKRKLNMRKRLMKKLKLDRTQETKCRLKNLSVEIKAHFTNEKKHKVRQGIMPGNNKSLWDAVKIAKDQNTDELPDEMNIDGMPIPTNEIAEEFAKMFEQKVKDIESTTNINDGVYNGNRKINEQNKNFMTASDVRKAILSLKLKNSEGFDRIPQRILLDGISVLQTPLYFNLHH